MTEWAAATRIAVRVAVVLGVAAVVGVVVHLLIGSDDVVLRHFAAGLAALGGVVLGLVVSYRG